MTQDVLRISDASVRTGISAHTLRSYERAGQADRRRGGRQQMNVFALEYRFPPDSRRRLEVRPRHRAFLEELNRRGHVIAAGPFADDSGALILYAAEDEAELERLLADDPYVAEDVFGTRSVREWRPFIAGDLGAVSTGHAP